MVVVAALLSGLLGAVFGAIAGFYFRAAEFRRDQRLKVYGEFIGAFLTMGHEGAGAASLYVAYGDSLFRGEHRDKLAELWPTLGEAMHSFEEATSRLRLVASKGARDAAEDLEGFIDRNIRQMPPMRPGLPKDADEWGEAARVGPRRIDEETVRLAR